MNNKLSGWLKGAFVLFLSTNPRQKSLIWFVATVGIMAWQSCKRQCLCRSSAGEGLGEPWPIPENAKKCATTETATQEMEFGIQGLTFPSWVHRTV